jgi:hypothetical protein
MEGFSMTVNDTKNNGYYSVVAFGTIFLGLYRYHGTKDYFDVAELWKQSKGVIDKFHDLLKEEGFARQPQNRYQISTVWFFTKDQCS